MLGKSLISLCLSSLSIKEGNANTDLIASLGGLYEFLCIKWLEMGLTYSKYSNNRCISLMNITEVERALKQNGKLQL